MTSDKSPKDGTALPWTGERYVPELEGQIALEHLHRYAMSRELAKDKLVLDIACGEGYGSAMLAEVANRVVGVDISEEVVDHARRKYSNDKLKFKVGTCSKIPVETSSVDLVVSFETIEHHDQHEAMLSEIKRVLRPNGVLIISSPEKHEYSEIPGHNNQFHVKELYRHEFEELMSSHFKHVAMYGQRVIYGSGILRERKISDVVSFNQEDGSIKVTKGIARPIYLIAVASDGAVPNVASGVFEQPINESQIVQTWTEVVRERDGHIASLNQALAKSEAQIASLNQTVSERDGQIASLNQALAKSEAQIASLNQTVSERDRQIASLNQAASERDGHIASLDQSVVDLNEEAVRRDESALRLHSELQELQSKLAAILRSNSWRITLPLREARRWVDAPKAQSKRYAKSVLRRLRRTYQALPFSTQTKALHRNWIARHAPRLLLASGANPASVPTVSISASMQPRLLPVVDGTSTSAGLARKYLRGVGLAIGSLDPNLRVPPNVSVDRADLPDYEDSAELKTSASRSHAAGEDMMGRRKTLAAISNEVYDFIVCDHVPGDLPRPVETLQTWLRVVRTGGILYLAVPDGSILSKSVSDLRWDGLGFKIVDSGVTLADSSKKQIYIVEKANYVSKIADMLQKDSQVKRLNAEHTVNVVVPIYNAYEEVERCLYSLFMHQDIYRIILIDDCSTDKRIKELLDTLQEYQGERFEIVKNDRNLGFLKTVNRGMQMVRGDVILLNSDTIVTTGWARKMTACAYSRDCVATVTPFTNFGLQCSIPEFWQNNEIPAGLTIDSFAQLVERCSVNRYPELVTAVGFCMYIRRAIIDEIGYFDEETFGRGYGEENDFSMRAMRKGYKNLLCDDTFVFHKVGASFLHTRDALIASNRVVLERKWPEFFPAMNQFLQLNPLKELQDNVKRELAKLA